MKRTCQRLQRILAEHGPTALRDDAAAQEHLADCAACFAVLEALAELDAALGELPPHDAPDELVESLLVRPELKETTVTHSEPATRLALPRVRWPWATAAAAAVTAVAVLGLWNAGLRRAAEPLLPDWAVDPAETLEGRTELSEEDQDRLSALGYVDAGGAVRFKPPASPPGQTPPPPPPPPALAPPPPPPAEVEVGRRVGEESQPTSSFDESITVTSEAPEIDVRKISAATTVSGFDKIPSARDPWAVLETLPDAHLSRTYYAFDGKADAPAEEPEPEAEDRAQALRGQDDADDSGRFALPPRRRAQDFLRRRAALDGLRFQPADGYWSNTYVPGDPAFRHLQARLLGRDRPALEAGSEADLRLHDAARQTPQPFDPPANAALAVYLHADRRQIRGETRMLVQVGLQGAERHSGRRPAMNVSLVLDAGGEIAAETAAALRALISAFEEAREPGDQFRLVVAGRPGGLVVGPEDFRHGPLTVAVERLLEDVAAPAGETLELLDALRTAILEVSRDDDPSTPLGSSAVVLLTSRPLDTDVAALQQLAHRSAVAGVPVSVVGVGDGVWLDELDPIALAGQGNRRLLQTAGEAPDLVARELSAVSRVVARAVRLRIRLAPGVRLVEVVGSRRLDAARAAQVREAESSIDQRLSRNLGIEADRGDDEDGIQIVIPSFYAGAAHVVLLEVVAPGPGAIADVRVRYKDLVHLENGQARARLSVRRGDPETQSRWARGPLELNVLKNLLAWRLRQVLEEAGTSVAEGETPSALRRLRDFRQLLAGLGAEVQGLEQDADLERDAAMLEEYARLLAAAEEPDELQYLEESMRYAGWLKVLPRPPALASAQPADRP